jgi:hypothetical protein
MMDRHDMDDIALLAALIIESRIWVLFLGIFGQGRSKARVFTFHVTTTFLSGHMIAADLTSLFG